MLYMHVCVMSLSDFLLVRADLGSIWTALSCSSSLKSQSMHTNECEHDRRSGFHLVSDFPAPNTEWSFHDTIIKKNCVLVLYCKLKSEGEFPGDERVQIKRPVCCINIPCIMQANIREKNKKKLLLRRAFYMMHRMNVGAAAAGVSDLIMRVIYLCLLLWFHIFCRQKVA